MDDQFYRKENPKWRKPDSFLKKLWKNKTIRWFIIIGILLLIFALFSNKGILQRIRLESENAKWEEKVRAAEEEQKQLGEELEAVEKDKKMIEKIAREKYDMVKEGEKVYKLKEKDE